MRVELDSKEWNAPDFMLIGAAKSGTTTFYHHLSSHPKVFFPPNKKEPFYFSFGGTQPNFTDERFNQVLTWQTEAYQNLYKDAPSNQLMGDASTSYLYTANQSIHYIRSYYGEEKMKKLKIMAVLRNPIDRAYSHYNYLLRNGFEELTFEQAIQAETIHKRKSMRWGFDYLEYGHYAQQLKPFMEAFPNMKVWLLEDLKDMQTVMDETFSFLELESIPLGKEVFSNPSGVPKSKILVNILLKNKLAKRAVNALPKNWSQQLKHSRDKWLKGLLKKQAMNPETRSHLIAYYTEEIHALENLLNRDLHGWLENK